MGLSLFRQGPLPFFMRAERLNRLVRVYVSAIVVLSVAALSASTLIARSPASAESMIGAAVYAVVGFGLQVAEHRLAVGTAHGTISFIVYMGAVLVFGPLWGGLVTGVSLAAAQTVLRKPLVKAAFNIAQHVLAILAGSFLYLALGGTFPLQSLNEAIIPFLGLVFGFFVVNSGAVSGVIAISEGRRFADVWISNTWGLAGYHLVASALGLAIAWLYVELGVLGIAIIVVPILFLRHTILVNVQLQETNRELLDLMVKAIEARDPYTSGHSQRVAEIARLLARSMGLLFRDVDSVATAALLHDVGKIYEEFAPILRKEGRLTPEERALMQTHVERSAELVGTISNLRGPVQRFVRHHHESFNGSGYPDGLIGDDIPIGARIIMIADTTDAMTTDRPYRKALTYDHVVEELERQSGRQFDPRLVAAFRRSAMIRRLVDRVAPHRHQGEPLGEPPALRIASE